MGKRRRGEGVRRPAGKRGRKPAAPVLGAMIDGNRRVLEVLDKHGVTFCPGCFLTLFSSPEKAAVYHAVPDVKAFLRDLEAAARPRR